MNLLNIPSNRSCSPYNWYKSVDMMNSLLLKPEAIWSIWIKSSSISLIREINCWISMYYFVNKYHLYYYEVILLNSCYWQKSVQRFLFWNHLFPEISIHLKLNRRRKISRNVWNSLTILWRNIYQHYGFRGVSSFRTHDILSN